MPKYQTFDISCCCIDCVSPLVPWSYSWCSLFHADAYSNRRKVSMYGMILYRIRTVSTIAKGIDFDFSIFFSGYRFRAVLVIGIVSNWISASYRNYYRNRVELRFVIVLNSSVSCRTRHRYHVEFVIGIVSNSLSVLYQTRYRHRIELDSRCCCCSATEGRLQYVTAVVYWFCWNS